MGREGGFRPSPLGPVETSKVRVALATQWRSWAPFLLALVRSQSVEISWQWSPRAVAAASLRQQHVLGKSCFFSVCPSLSTRVVKSIRVRSEHRSWQCVNCVVLCVWQRVQNWRASLDRVVVIVVVSLSRSQLERENESETEKRTDVKMSDGRNCRGFVKTENSVLCLQGERSTKWPRRRAGDAPIALSLSQTVSLSQMPLFLCVSLAWSPLPLSLVLRYRCVRAHKQAARHFVSCWKKNTKIARPDQFSLCKSHVPLSQFHFPIVPFGMTDWYLTVDVVSLVLVFFF